MRGSRERTRRRGALRPERPVGQAGHLLPLLPLVRDSAGPDPGDPDRRHPRPTRRRARRTRVGSPCGPAPSPRWVECRPTARREPVSDYVLAIDAGTTGVTVLLFDRDAAVVRKAYSEFAQHYPKPGWVEHDAEEIWAVTQRLIGEVIGEAGPERIAAVGITNQRETTVLWDAETRTPFHRAIVWQCRRTAERCQALAAHAEEISRKTGLVLDAYFSATKLEWLLEHAEGARAAAEAGRARFGTIDTWLVDRLTAGASHATDPTNASRTLLYDIHARRWDDGLLSLFGVPRSVLPEVKPSAGTFGVTAGDVFGAEVPIAGIAGDQQAALFGQGCVRPGAAKNTYGTGCFALLNAGSDPVRSERGLVTTLGCDARGAPVYCLEGSVFIGGAVVQWLRDELRLVGDAAETEAHARAVADNGGVYFVPAFVGLGAPHWDQDARGLICGLTRGSGRDHVVRAALESIAYQSRDLIEALQADSGVRLSALKVDGGACKNDFLMQFQADVLGIPVVRPKNIETTAQGAAFLAGLGSGFWSSFEEVERVLAVDRTWEPTMSADERTRLLAGWEAAVARARSR
ncbi:MAG: glycerol kinase [Planctomycetota bacterium]|nr:MAG: glycerol kinase [Planctomycetota bacterium]